VTADAIVLGAGPNGLAAAALLARAGRRVLVLERGTATPVPDWEAGWVLPALVRDLALDRHGWTPSLPDPWLTIPLPKGGTLALHRDVARTAEAIRRVNPADGARWPEFCERAARVARFLAGLYAAPPPHPVPSGAGDLLQLAGIARRARGLGRTGLTDLLRWLPMPVQDLLDDWFSDETLKGALGGLGVSGTRYGPRAGGTAFVLLHHHAGSPAGVFRSESTGLRGALATAARGHGVEIRTGAEAARVLVARDRSAGVVLTTGEEITSDLVVSSADPRRTFLDLLGPDHLDPEFLHAVRSIRFRGATALVELSTAGRPPFAGLAAAPSLDHLERAADAGAVGGSIEDWDPAGALYGFDHAVERVAAAVEAARRLEVPFTLTARAENLIHGVDDLEDTIARLRAYELAGADVLYAPGVRDLATIRTVVSSVTKPVNVVMSAADPDLSVAQLASVGVKRISVGGALSRLALAAFMKGAREMAERGGFTWMRDTVPSKDLKDVFRRWP